MNENIVISNMKEFEQKKEEFIKGGKNKMHVLSDFDRTLTKAFVNGEKTPSIISELRRKNYISEDYSRKANELADEYHPIEINLNLPIKEREKSMYEWWTKHFNLLIKSGLKKEHIKQVIDSERIQFRKGAVEFLDFLYEKNIPLIIMTSAGLGKDSIKMMLEKRNRMYDNIYIISNEFKWGSKGNAVSIKQPIIHVLNKKEITVKNLPIYKELLKRKNILLLGDSIGDIDMVEGFHYDNLIKIGFLSYEIEKNLENYKDAFDVILLNDADMNYVGNLVEELLK